MFRNRIAKNSARVAPWAERNGIEAYRLYDRDIPEFPFIIDRYQDKFVVYDRGDARIERDRARLPAAVAELQASFGAKDADVFVKSRFRQKGIAQYERLASEEVELVVREGEARFLVNLSDYLDTGLFLDHRLMRERVRKAASGRRILNLFSYTGSVSVLASLGGATFVRSVDLSATYLRWARRNFTLNALQESQHDLVRANVLEHLAYDRERYDLIFLDPPTFSNSKAMDDDFEVERDQDKLVELCVARLAPGGRLWFSCNKRSFKLSEKIKTLYSTRDITDATIPFDFRDKKIHCAFDIARR